MVTWLAIVLGLLPAFVWLVFFLQEDRQKPEPKKLILSTFIWGGLAAFIALQLQIQVSVVAKILEIREFSPILIFAMAAVEELVKFMVVFLWVRSRKEFDEPIDAMIYLIVAALGFSTTENIASAIRSTSGFELMTLRFLGATLLHSLSSALVGFYWALSLIRGSGILKSVLTGLFLAAILHGVFNGLILIYGPAFQITLFLVFVAFFILNDFEKIKKEEQLNLNN